MISGRTVFEALLTFLAVVVLPGAIIGLFMPCYTYQQNTKIDKYLPEDSYFVHALPCEGSRRIIELTQTTVDLTIIMPAFNEEDRLPVAMDATLAYMHAYSQQRTLNDGKQFAYEILVVDDYSTDSTAQIVLQYAAEARASAEARVRASEHEKRGELGEGEAASIAAGAAREERGVDTAPSIDADADDVAAADTFSTEMEVGLDGYPENKASGEEALSNKATGAVDARAVDAGIPTGSIHIQTQMHVPVYVETVIPDIRLLRLSRNHGKGGAIKRGVLNSRGLVVLFADADGATDISYLDSLIQQLYKIQTPLLPTHSSSGSFASSAVPATATATAPLHGLVVGSRAHLASQSIAVRKWYRTVLMHGFHFLVKAILNAGGSGSSALVQDTQCGFKLFTRQTARLLFTNLHLEGWVFDIELLYLADHMHIPVSEVAVAWHEVDGSKLIRNKLDVVFTSLRMARDMLCMKLAYVMGLWKPIYLR